MTRNNPNLIPVDINPIDEVLEHVHQLALWEKSPSVHISVGYAFEELEAFEVPLTVDALHSVMNSFFGSPHYAAREHESFSSRELAVLYPGVTSQLLLWYVTLA